MLIQVCSPFFLIHVCILISIHTFSLKHSQIQLEFNHNKSMPSSTVNLRATYKHILCVSKLLASAIPRPDTRIFSLPRPRTIGEQAVTFQTGQYAEDKFWRDRKSAARRKIGAASDINQSSSRCFDRNRVINLLKSDNIGRRDG